MHIYIYVYIYIYMYIYICIYTLILGETPFETAAKVAKEKDETNEHRCIDMIVYT
jgi:hypothetical protein